MIKKSSLLSGGLVLLIGLFPGLSGAEDCTGTLPGGNCTLDEDTAAPLTIDTGVTLNIGGSVELGHEIDGDDAPGDGTITTGGAGYTITQSADIGAGTAIDAINFNDGGGETWTTSAAITTNNDGSDINLGAGLGGETLRFINGGSYSGEIDGNSGDLVDFGADGNGGNFRTGGQIEGVALTVTSGRLTTANSLGSGTALGTVTVSDGAQLIAGENVTSGAALNLDGLIEIGGGKVVSATSYTANADAGDVVIGITRSADTTEAGQLNISGGGPLDLSNDRMRFKIAAGAQPLASETLSNVVVGNTGPTVAPGTVEQTSYLYDFSLEANGNNLDLTIARNALESVSSNANNLKAARLLLDDQAGSSNPEINLIQSGLGNASSRTEFNDRLESVQPAVDGGYVMASRAAVKEVANVIHHQRGLRRDGGGMTGVSAGDAEAFFEDDSRNEKRRKSGGGGAADRGKALRLWVETFGYSGEQDTRTDISGYEMSGSGLALGADTGTLDDKTIYGLAVAYSASEIDSSNASRPQTDTDTYQIAIYADREVAENTTLGGALSYAYNDNKMSRSNIGGISGLDAGADFTSEEISARMDVAHEFRPGDAVTVTPRGIINYSHLTTDNYTERGAGGASLENVESDSIDRLDVGAGVEITVEKDLRNGQKVIPSVHAEYLYDLVGDDIGTIANLNGAGTRFRTRGFEAQRHSADLGVGLAYQTAEKWELGVKYGYHYNQDYSAHSGHARAAYKF